MLRQGKQELSSSYVNLQSAEIEGFCRLKNDPGEHNYHDKEQYRCQYLCEYTSKHAATGKGKTDSAPESSHHFP